MRAYFDCDALVFVAAGMVSAECSTDEWTFNFAKLSSKWEYIRDLKLVS